MDPKTTSTSALIYAIARHAAGEHVSNVALELCEDELNRRVPTHPSADFHAINPITGSITLPQPAPVSGWQTADTAPVGERVLVLHDGQIKIAEWRDGQWWSNFPTNSYMRRNGPSMWMPLPEVPR